MGNSLEFILGTCRLKTIRCFMTLFLYHVIALIRFRLLGTTLCFFVSHVVSVFFSVLLKTE